MRIQTSNPPQIAPSTLRPSAPAETVAQPKDVVLSSDGKLASWMLRRPMHAAAGATTGAAVGAGIGALIHSGPISLGLGGAIGAAIGTAIGNSADHISYSTKAKLREFSNRVDQTRAETVRTFTGTNKDANLKPLGPQNLVSARKPGASARAYDGCDSSRDITGLYASEGAATEPYRFDVEVAHLRPAAEHGYLDTTLMIAWGDDKGNGELPAPLHGTTAPWKMALQIDNDKNIQIIDGPEAAAKKAGELVTARHSNVFNRVEIALDKTALREAGWKDGQPLRLQAATSVDGADAASSVITGASTDHADASKIFRWEGKTVYYAVTDRFNNGDPTNDGPRADKNSPDRFHGGDWQGVIDKLDYLKDLNVDCVWLSPPYEQQRDFTNVHGWNGDGFHGYWPMDFTKPDPNWGDRAKLKELVAKAHDRGMKVMLDVVLNHSAYGHPFLNDPDKKDWFHDNGNISGLGQWSMENQALCGLPDFAQEKPEVSHYLMEVHKDWLQDVDAFRLDALRHMPEKFLRDFNETMHKEKPDFYSVGEAFWLNSNFVAGYQNRTTDSMFDFPLAYAVRRTFAGDESRTLKDRLALYKEVKPHASQHEAYRMLLDSHKSQSMKLISDVLNNDRLYDNPAKLGTFIDNHDMVRFASDIGGDERRLEGALAFLFAVRGTPHVYYGTEVGMTGIGNQNRNDMEFDSNPEMQASFKKLSGARHSSQALQNGSQQELFVGTDTYAFSRIRPEEEVVCVFNKGEKPQTLTFPLNPESPIPDKTSLKEMFGGEDVVVKDNKVTVTLPARGYTYLQWKAPV